jgi:hypothetical protein
MPWWALLLFVFFVWCLWAAAGILEVKVHDARDPLPDGTHRGFTFMPIIPVFPLLAWGIAKLIDLMIMPWGTLVIGLLHAILGVVAIPAIVIYWMRLRSLRKDKSTHH